MSHASVSGHVDNPGKLADYSTAMAAGDEEALFKFFAPEFKSHVTERV